MTSKTIDVRHYLAVFGVFVCFYCRLFSAFDCRCLHFLPVKSCEDYCRKLRGGQKNWTIRMSKRSYIRIYVGVLKISLQLNILFASAVKLHYAKSSNQRSGTLTVYLSRTLPTVQCAASARLISLFGKNLSSEDQRHLIIIIIIIMKTSKAPLRPYRGSAAPYSTCT